ncbi:Monoterpene epsilon-lactone hydrolase [uncultured Ruminococcus sp.]|uniref:alpha/beta hydrolase n=1 Tax=Pseudoruminococcus massiliensis TaxID=2086583 RepID=UPI000820E869|nr:Monoterpene epsilon-lactone hydrolase [uncultured Ruminococcus sp.]
MKSDFIKNFLKTAQPIVNRIPLMNQRSYQTTFFTLKSLPSDVIYDEIEDFSYKAEWVIPPEEDPEKVIFYTHGGGYGMGDLISSRALIAPIAKKTGIRVFSFEYRLAPEHPFPAAFDDAKEAYEYVLGQGYSPGNIIAFGESAGGGLAVSNILRLIAEGKEAPQCLVTISPWSDLTATGQTYFLNEDKDPLLRGKYLKRLADSYVGDDSPLNPYISPAFASYDDRFPPTLIQAGSDEVLLDDSKLLYNAMKDGGVDVDIEIYPKMWHVFHIWQIEESDKAITAIDEFIKRKV